MCPELLIRIFWGRTMKLVLYFQIIGRTPHHVIKDSIKQLNIRKAFVFCFVNKTKFCNMQ